MGIVTDIPMGRGEIAHMLKVKPNTVSQWIARELFPEHDITTSRQRLWLHSTVRTWAIMTKRWPYEEGEQGDLLYPRD
ncbi:MAG: hypothetical protein HKO03_01750 [Acidimicrobiia bacterium]|nr:hypothetical protein [Acidimicrobiia bacterium]